MNASLIAALLGVAQPAPDAGPAVGCSGPAADCAELAALNRRWLDSYVSRDIEALADLLADEFIAISGGGARRNRDETIARVRDSRRRIRSVDVENLHIQVVGDVAVVTARSVLAIDREGAPVRNDYADTYVRRNGRWRAVSAHVVRVAPPG